MFVRFSTLFKYVCMYVCMRAHPRCAGARRDAIGWCSAPLAVMDTGDDASRLSKGFVVGSLAFWLGKRAEENKSHEWTVHVRSANEDEDPGLWIKRVVFTLHPTLQPPTRGARALRPTRARDCARL